MIGLFGIAFVFIMVFGGYILAGGKMGIILKALPFEMIMIGGAAIGAFLISNDFGGIKATCRDMLKVFKGPKWKRSDYIDLLCLLFELIKLEKAQPLEVEAHIDSPSESSIFKKYPKILKDTETINLICDTLRAASLNFDDPYQVEDLLDKRIDANNKHALHSSHALQTIADGLPALGIVAAVLGVIKTMASIDQPPEVLGKMIGGALVGTFLGVFLAYGFFGPFASRVRAISDEEAHFNQLIREVLVANLHHHPTNMCIEVGRQNTPEHFRPHYDELELELKTLKNDAA